MGKRPTNRTRSGRYINPTEQYRKYLKQKEQKRNKTQRTNAKNNVLSGKDPHQILNELEELDLKEFDVSREETALVVVWHEKRKKLRENFDKILKFLEKEDVAQFDNLKNLLHIYELTRSQRQFAYERAKMAQEINIEDIPMPADLPEDLPEPIEESPQQIHVQVPKEIPEKVEESDEELSFSDFELKYGDPPPPPSGSLPVLSSEEEEDNNYWQPYQSGGNLFQYQQYSNMIPQEFNPNYEEPYYVPQQNYYHPPTEYDQPYEYICPPVIHTNPQKSNYLAPIQSYQPDAIIEAKPQIRNLREAATCFTPTVLKIQRQCKDVKGKQSNTYRPKIPSTDPLHVETGEPKENSKDDDYERFMKEIKEFL